MLKPVALFLVVYAAGAPLPSTLLPDVFAEPMRAFHRDVNEQVGDIARRAADVAGREMLGLGRLTYSPRRGLGG